MRGSASVPARGFVLAGGRSSRMGVDKALLPIDGQSLLERIASRVRGAAGNVTIIADPNRYAGLGFPVLADRRSGCGPLGGVVTAIEISERPWNLIVACDMPNIDTPFLEELLDAAAEQTGVYDCLVPLGPDGPEPLCAVYHRRALVKLQPALDRNLFKMKAVIALLETRFLPLSGAGRFRNVNTPEDWAQND